MQGRRKLYDKHFGKNTNKSKYVRGRSNNLINIRDRKLAIRYWYYTVIKKLSYEETIKHLQAEFDIAEYTVVKRLEKENGHINQLMESNPAIAELKKEFSYFIW